METMSEHDRLLCQEALHVKGYDYGKLFELEDSCVSQEGKDFIWKIATRLYHDEEYHSDMM